MPASTPRTDGAEAPSTVNRRRLFGGAATVGALAAAAAVLPTVEAPVETAAAPATDDGGDKGYRLTAHVQRYYQTART